MAYSSGNEATEAYFADLGRVRIGHFYLQIDDEQTPQMIGGQAYVRAYFFEPASTPEGRDAETGIIIDPRGTPTRFAKIPVSILSQAVPVLGSQKGTAQLLQRFIQQAARFEAAPDHTP